MKISSKFSTEWLQSRILCGIKQREEVQKHIKESKIVKELKDSMHEQPMSDESKRLHILKCYEEANDAGIFHPSDVQGDWLRFFRAQDEMGQVWPGTDIAFCASANVNVFAGCVLRLGTEKHQYILKELDKGKALGCFALTEIKHGIMSGEQMKIETTAEYDPATQQFTINSNGHLGGKDWVTNLSAEYTKYAVVVAVLNIKHRYGNEGAHCFLINIRDDANKLLSGIKIEDCGEKNSFKGVFSSRMWLNDVKVPRDALLDRHTQVLPDGSFATSLGSMPESRFSMVSGELMSGTLIAASAINTRARNALWLITNSLALRCQERVKKDKSVDRTYLLDTLTSKQPILSHVCTQIGLSITLRKIRKRWDAVMKFTAAPAPAELVNEIYGLKQYAARTCSEALSTCVGLSGSRGALEANFLSDMRNSLHTLSSIDGDRMMVMQKCAGVLIDSHGSSKLSLLRLVLKGELLSWTGYIWTWIDPYCYTRLWYLKFLLRSREVLIRSRLLRKVSRGRNAYIWNTRCLTLAQELCDVFIERIIVRDIMEEKGGCDSSVWSTVLSPILIVFILTSLSRDKGNLWLQQNTIHEAVEMICANTTRDSCISLVEAFVHELSPVRKLPMVFQPSEMKTREA